MVRAWLLNYNDIFRLIYGLWVLYCISCYVVSRLFSPTTMMRCLILFLTALFPSLPHIGMPFLKRYDYCVQGKALIQFRQKTS